MTKIPSIREIQNITKNSHLMLVEEERERICREIEKAAKQGHNHLWIDCGIFDENTKLLIQEGYYVKQRCDEWGIGTTISWYPEKVKKRIFSF